MLLPLLSVSESCADLPVSTSPKLRPLGTTVSCGCTPMPLNVAVSGSGVAELGTLNVPTRPPMRDGVNRTEIVQLAPPAILAPEVQRFPELLAVASV